MRREMITAVRLINPSPHMVIFFFVVKAPEFFLVS